eukprot:TRINITY_DN12106_c0_g1_i2.p1 TRINITY_DN12106_c0_g1~~TRINITY_DN12106_c0_g1_i2.p1  ORF type:complete len:181 (+),score=12.43 TRINITY_DN12106_c0_g1_i2:268-810(+)
MGQFFSFLRDLISGLREQRILLVGLDNAGKTTILYKMKLGDHVAEAVPTVGFNVETVQWGKLDLLIWDVGGGESVRHLWRHYYAGVNAIVFVVDAHDTHRLPEAVTELKQMMEEDMLRNARFLVFANKQDLPGALRREDIIKHIALGDSSHVWEVQECSAIEGSGLTEGFEWLSEQLTRK